MKRLLCRLIGHQPFIYDALPDGRKIRGCPRCGSYVVRQTADPRPIAPPDPRVKLPEREQWRARTSAVRRLRGIRIRRASRLTEVA